MRSTVEALVRLTDDVFDLSKLEAGSLTITSPEFDLGGLLADMAKIFEPAVRRKGLEFTIEYAAGMPRRFLGDSSETPAAFAK